MKRIEINFVYIDDKNLYKQKDIVKNLYGKDTISYTNISDKPGIDIVANKNLVACLMLKKFNRLLSKNKDFISIYYFISQYNEDILKNLYLIVNKYSDNILYKLYSDNMELKLLNNISKLCSIEELFDYER